MIAEATKTTNIWILEDHELFAKQIRRLIASESDLCCPHHFSSAADLYDKLKSVTHGYGTMDYEVLGFRAERHPDAGLRAFRDDPLR